MDGVSSGNKIGNPEGPDNHGACRDGREDACPAPHQGPFFPRAHEGPFTDRSRLRLKSVAQAGGEAGEWSFT